MSNHASIKVAPGTQVWLSGSPLGSYAGAFIERLGGLGYTANTISNYLASVAHFAHWCTCERTRVSNIDENVVACFLERHLPTCRCAPRCRRARADVRAALAQLLKLLRATQCIAAKTSCVPPSVASELRDFGVYLTDVRGLRAVTRDTRCKHVSDFLYARFGVNEVRIHILVPEDIERYIMSVAARWKPASVGVLGNSLRSYLRYKAVLGDDTTALVAAIPQVAQWPLARLHLTQRDCRRVTSPLP